MTESFMGNAIAMHIGLDRIDPAFYGTNGALSGCVNDARAMQTLAKSLGYQSQLLANEQATAGAISKGIVGAASKLRTGDIFLLTYSGHGSQVADITADESDRFDETWCLFDRMLLDDELHFLWAAFAPGVRIVVVSDSCHSGTVTKNLALMSKKRELNRRQYRFLDAELAQQLFEKNRFCYESLKFTLRTAPPAIGATVLLLSACKDEQLAEELGGSGVFTKNLLSVFGGGNYNKNYTSFVMDIDRAIASVSQTPRCMIEGAENLAFVAQRPFFVSSKQLERIESQSDEIEFKWRIGREFFDQLNSSERDLFLRTTCIDTLSDGYAHWQVVAGALRSSVRGEVSGRCETDFHGHEHCSIEVKASF
jgi:metacaspase-1